MSSDQDAKDKDGEGRDGPVDHVHRLGWPERAVMIVLTVGTAWALFHDKWDKIGGLFKAIGNLFS